MNRKQRIMLSITGILLVILILAGITYGYFITNIKRNENDKSISVSTANLELEYGDGQTQILTNDTVLIPSAEPIGSKDFTVTNKGIATDYSVIIDNVSIINVIDGKQTTFESNDFRYTLICTTSSGSSCNSITEQKLFPINGGIMISNAIDEGDIHSYVLTMWYIDTGKNQSADMNKTYNARVNITDITTQNPFATEDGTMTLASAIIENSQNKTNGTEFVTMTKTIPMKETSAFDYEKGEEPTTFPSELSSATSYYIVYADNYTLENKGGTLQTPVYTLFNNDGSALKYIKYEYNEEIINMLKGKYIVVYTEEPVLTDKVLSEQLSGQLYKLSTEASDFAENTIKYSTIIADYKALEKELSATQDNYGTSYFFRGGVEDNYVLFNNICFRIVRIEGDGSVKLTLAGEVSEGATTCNEITNNSAIISTKGYEVYGFKNILAPNGTTLSRYDYLNYEGGLKTVLETWFDSKFKTTDEDGNKVLTESGEKVKNDIWCLGASYDYKYDTKTGKLLNDDAINQMTDYSWRYATGIRYQVTLTTDLTCGDAEEEFLAQVGALTSDEAALAGVDDKIANLSIYLADNASNNNLLLSIFNGGTMDRPLYVNSRNVFGWNAGVKPPYGAKARPAITLVPGVEISSGDGTINNPYVVE